MDARQPIRNKWAECPWQPKTKRNIVYITTQNRYSPTSHTTTECYIAVNILSWNRPQPDCDPLSENRAHVNPTPVCSCRNWGLDRVLDERQAEPSGTAKCTWAQLTSVYIFVCPGGRSVLPSVSVTVHLHISTCSVHLGCLKQIGKHLTPRCTLLNK